MITMQFWFAVSPPEEDLQSILHKEVKIAATALKKGTSAGIDNIPAELT